MKWNVEIGVFRAELSTEVSWSGKMAYNNRTLDNSHMSLLWENALAPKAQNLLLGIAWLLSGDPILSLCVSILSTTNCEMEASRRSSNQH